MRWFSRSGAIAVADGARDAKQWDIAARHYRKALDRNPRNWPIWVQYGHALKEFSRHAEAEAAYRQALAYNPRAAELAPPARTRAQNPGQVRGGTRCLCPCFRARPVAASPTAGTREFTWSEAEIVELLRQAVPRSPVANANGDERASEERIALSIDKAALANSGLATVSGWAFAEPGIRRIEVLVDAIRAGDAEHGLPRPDVGQDHPTVAAAARSGFKLERELGRTFEGHHLVTVIVHDGDGARRQAELPVRAGTAPRPAPSAMPEPEDESLRLFVDVPKIVSNRAVQVVRDSLRVEGWATAPEGVHSVVVSVDGIVCGSAKYGLRREDVGKMYPDWDGSHLSGYAIASPRRFTGPQVLAAGDHLVRVELCTRTGRAKGVEFFIEATDPTEENSPWSLRRKIARSEIDLTDNILSGLGWHPQFGIVIGIADPDDAAFDATVGSLRDQAYERWQAVVLPRRAGLRSRLNMRLASKFPDLGERLTIAAEGYTGDLIDCIGATSDGGPPDLIGFVSAGDVLAGDALLQMAVSAGIDRDADFFYADERRRSPVSGRIEPFFKPQWSPDLLLATNYIGRFWCARRELLDRISASVDDWRRFGEYDLVLRCTEVAQRIEHVPHLLCERGRELIDEPAREREALARAIALRDMDGEVLEDWAPGYYRLLRRPRYSGVVSIIMPTGGNVPLISKCLPGLFERTAYQNFELIILYNTSTKPEVFPYLDTIKGDPRVRIIDSKGPFNFSRICNLGAAAARGDFLLFLNDDIEVIEPDWIETLLQHAERPEIGAVGARLLYPDRTIQHAGIFWAAGAGGGRHAFRFAPQSDPGYFGLAVTPRNVLAVTGACIMMRRSWFDEIGRFDESHTVVNNDVDICLRCWSHGGRVVYEPAATLIHHELASRHNLPDEYDVKAFWERWGRLLKTGDPYYHPNLLRNSEEYTCDEEPIRLIYAGYPLFRREDISRILVLKLDHIGDFITAVPAINRLHEHFPSAELYLLAPPASAALTRALVPVVKEVINFEYFHARSALGRLEVSQEDLSELGDRTRALPLRSRHRPPQGARHPTCTALFRCSMARGIRSRR